MSRNSWVTVVWLAVACGAPGSSLDAGLDASMPEDAGTPTPDAGPCTSDTWANYGEAFFSSTCGGCHFNLRSPTGVESKLTTIASVIGAGDMPLGGSLTEAQRQRAVRYLTCGAP